MRRLVALALLALAAHATSPGRTTLGKFVNRSEFVCAGRVARVHEVPAGEVGGTVRVAEVEVLAWFKGSARPERIWYLAEGRVDADHSTAVAGERALLFLHQPRGPLWAEGEIEKRLASPSFRARLKKLTKGAPMLLLAFLGRGRMPLTTIEGVEYAEVDAWLVHLPWDAPTIPAPDPRRDLDRRVPFAYVERLVLRRLAPLGEKTAVGELIEAIDTDSKRMNDLLEELDRDAAVPVLLELLDDPAYPRRDTVAEALILCEQRLTPDLLLERLSAKDVTVRRASAFALEVGFKLEIVGGDEPVMEAVTAALSDPDPQVRAHAVGTLAHLYEFERLVAALADPSPLVRAAARRTLLRLADVLLEAKEEFPRAKAEVALLPWVAAEDAGVRREVWEVLSYAAGPKSRSAVERALADADRVVRLHAVRSLGRLGASKRLIAFLATEDAWLRRAAAYELGLGRIEAAVEPLAEALGDPDEIVVDLAIEALGKNGPAAAAAVPALEALLKRPGGKLWEEEVAEALKRIRP